MNELSYALVGSWDRYRTWFMLPDITNYEFLIWLMSFSVPTKMTPGDFIADIVMKIAAKMKTIKSGLKSGESCVGLSSLIIWKPPYLIINYGELPTV